MSKIEEWVDKQVNTANHMADLYSHDLPEDTDYTEIIAWAQEMSDRMPALHDFIIWRQFARHLQDKHNIDEGE